MPTSLLSCEHLQDAERRSPFLWRFPSCQSICVHRRGAARPPRCISGRVHLLGPPEAPQSTRSRCFPRRTIPEAGTLPSGCPWGEPEPPLSHANPGVSFPPAKRLAALLPKNAFCFCAVFIEGLILDACLSMSVSCNGILKEQGTRAVTLRGAHPSPGHRVASGD